MEILSVRDDTSKKALLLEELKRYGVIFFNVDEALKAPEYTLERLLQEVKSKQDISTRTQDLFMDVYESMIRDYITKLTVASVFFFSCNPWAALFWPPYYYYYYNNKRSKQ
jgi:hypothetical protein